MLKVKQSIIVSIIDQGGRERERKRERESRTESEKESFFIF